MGKYEDMAPSLANVVTNVVEAIAPTHHTIRDFAWDGQEKRTLGGELT